MPQLFYKQEDSFLCPLSFTSKEKNIRVKCLSCSINKKTAFFVHFLSLRKKKTLE